MEFEDGTFLISGRYLLCNIIFYDGDCRNVWWAVS